MGSAAEEFYNNEQTTDVLYSSDDEYILDSSEDAGEGIGLLVSMAKSGKIDPWNIDIVDVTNKYLIQMAEQSPENLVKTGRTLWLASVLIKMKSNVLVGLGSMDYDSLMAENQFEEYDDFEPEYSQPVKKSNVVSINEALKRRLSTRLNRNRTVTLQDLIKQLKFYEELDRKQAFKNSLERAKRRARSYENFSAEDIVNLAHDEYIEQTVNKLKIKLEEIFVKREKVELNSLVELGMDKISAYIALLFLSAESDIDLVQQEFYGDLYIQKSTIQSEIA